MRAKLVLVVLIMTVFMRGADSRDLLPVDVDKYPWSSIGKLYNRAGGVCTGAVISPSEVLTAAHCLYSRRTGVLLQPESLHFLLGYKQGEYRYDLGISKFTIGPSYKPDRSGTPERDDWAILKLALPVSAQVKPVLLAEKPLSVGNRIMVGGFARPRGFVMTADTDCRVRAILLNGLIVHDCAVVEGDSGAPLMRENGDMIEVVGVNIAKARINGVEVKIAVSATSLDQTTPRP